MLQRDERIDEIKRLDASLEYAVMHDDILINNSIKLHMSNRLNKGDKILTLEANPGKGHHSKHGYKVFTEKGLYMLAKILENGPFVASPNFQGGGVERGGFRRAVPGLLPPLRPRNRLAASRGDQGGGLQPAPFAWNCRSRRNRRRPDCGLVLVDESLSPRMTIVGGEVMHS